MDSSPDLSLKLRRGSSDSRESFYMDFAQGIDSDIEEVTTIVEPPPPPQITTQAPSPPLEEIPVPAEVIILDEIRGQPAIMEEDEAVSDVGAEDDVGIVIEEDDEEEQEEECEEEIDEGLDVAPVNDVEENQEIEDEIEVPEEIISHISEPESLKIEEEFKDEAEEQPQEEKPPVEEPEDQVQYEMESHTSSPTSLPPPPPTPPAPPTDIDESSSNDVGSEQLAASPSSANNTIISPETLSHHTSPAKSPPLQTPKSPPPIHYHVKIDESPQRASRAQSPPSTTRAGTASVEPLISHESETCIVETRSSTPNQLALSTPTCSTSGTTQHLALLYHHHTHHQHLHPILTQTRKLSRLPETSMMRYSSPPHREIKAIDAFTTTLSALYGKLIVIMGVAFPLSEVISTYIPPSFYESFYLYLYIGSMVFLLFMYATLLWGRPKPLYTTSVKQTKAQPRRSSSCSSNSGNESDRESETGSSGNNRQLNVAISPPPRRPSLLPVSASGHQHYGSFYLRMGAVAFGIGSMIYSGLEFGQYFELERDTKCHNVLLALTPATRMVFIFIQMYFIFLNNEQIKVYRHKILARFGLMHMIGTNLSVWLSVLIQETKHEILTFYDPENRTLKISHRLGHKTAIHTDTSVHLRMPRGLKGPHHIFECRRTNIIGTLVQDASPFLFPCTIEYSLICAAILYVMWRNVSNPPQEPPIRRDLSSFKRSPHHYSVDCARAHKGLFVGILILVLTIISLILFFVLISRPEFVSLAVTEVTVCELTLYATATIATLIGMIQVRHLQYDAERSFQLDDILLVGAQSGLFLYSTFTVIGGHFTLRKDTILVLINALASIVQTACQTMFILDAGRRNAATPEHIRKKPGREIVTFLLVANLAMWAISTLEKSRAESHPIQLNFYGLWAWTIITHVSMPLAIFYRFHSTVCLCEIWKRAYKLKPTYM